jgi:hypothetical protein
VGILDGGPMGLIALLRATEPCPTHIVMDPLGWAALRKIKTLTGATVDSNESLLAPEPPTHP